VNARIRVLHLIDSLDLGGAQTTLLAWLESHNRERFAVELAAIHGTHRSLHYERAAALQIPIHLLSARRWLPAYLILLPWLLARRRYHVVHCHLFASNWLGKPLARLLGVPIVISHDQCNDAFRTNSGLITTIDRWANRFADWIFVASMSIKEFLVSVERLPARMVEVVAPGLPEPKPSLKKASSGKIIGGAGRLVAQKNFKRFLELAHALRELDPSYEFVIAGDGPLAHQLRRHAERLQLPVRWLGTLPSLEEFFAEIDLFLLTSDYEGLPVTILEALEHAVPVAATAVDGVQQQLAHEVLLIDLSKSVPTLANEIHAFLRDPVRQAELTRLGKELIERKFRAKSQIASIEEKYLELLTAKDVQRRDL
jgi:glycosyltransferase involved in cell wall biosynthesis